MSDKQWIKNRVLLQLLQHVEANVSAPSIGEVFIRSIGPLNFEKGFMIMAEMVREGLICHGHREQPLVTLTQKGIQVARELQAAFS